MGALVQRQLGSMPLTSFSNDSFGSLRTGSFLVWEQLWSVSSCCSTGGLRMRNVYGMYAALLQAACLGSAVAERLHRPVIMATRNGMPMVVK